MADEKIPMIYTGQANELNGEKDPYGKKFELTIAEMRSLGGGSHGHSWEAVRKSDADKLAGIDQRGTPPPAPEPTA